MQIIKHIVALFIGAALATCVLVFLSPLIRPRVVGLSAASLEVSVVKLEGKNFVAVTGRPFNALGAHQYFAYCVSDDKVELSFFVTRLAFPNAGAFQSDWPLLIPGSKLLSERVRLTCMSRSGEEVVATILKTGDNLEIQRSKR
jgi:hypothetical protein